jgi:hypothetical protein
VGCKGIVVDKRSVESLITCSIVLLATVIFTMGYVRDFGILCIVMGAGGVAYITILSKLYTGSLYTAKYITTVKSLEAKDDTYVELANLRTRNGLIEFYYQLLLYFIKLSRSIEVTQEHL